MKKRRMAFRTLLFLLVTFTVVLFLYWSTQSPRREIPPLQRGYGDLSAFDFDTKLAILPADTFRYYPNKLYTPVDVAQGNIPKHPPLSKSDLQEAGYYGTYRMILNLSLGESYGISAYSARYSQRLFINGEEKSLIGYPNALQKATTFGTDHYTVYFTPETSTTEILIQVASLRDADRALYDLILGTAEKITVRDTAVQTQIHLIEGGILTALLLSVGLYLFFNRNIHLWFCLACIAVFVRIAIMEENNTLPFLSQLPWEAALRLEYVATIMLVFCFVFYVKNLFAHTFQPYVMYAFGAGCILYAVVVLILPAVLFSKWAHIAIWGTRLFWIYVEIALVLHVIRNRKTVTLDQIFLFSQTVLFISFGLLDTYLYKRGGYNLSLGLVNFGMLICIHLNTIALVIEYSNTLNERDQAMLAEQEVRETNRLLDRLSRVRTEFLQNLSHELRTPLTVMSNCAGLTVLQIRQKALDKDTLENLDVIKREAVRLGQMVEQLKEFSVEKERQLTLTEIDAESLLRRAADFCAPICIKNQNKVAVTLMDKPIFVYANEDAMFQVLLNLIINATRHTNRDTILLKAEQIDDGACISVTDDGDGIPTELMPHVFTRYVSGDDSNGLGLPICKEIIEQHGGTMEIQSAPDQGTTIYLNLPGTKEDTYGTDHNPAD